MTEIVVAVISGIITLIGTVATVIIGMSKANKNIEIVQAVMSTKLDGLTAEVREHNNFARRMPVVEEQIKVINHRIDDLEKKVG